MKIVTLGFIHIYKVEPNKCQYEIHCQNMKWLVAVFLLGPVFFLIFINDLPLSLEAWVTSVDLYGNDTTIYDVQPNKEKIEENLQKIFNIVR